MNSSGDFIIVWRQNDTSNIAQIFKYEYRDGTVTAPANRDDNITSDGTDAIEPFVAMNDNGKAVIAWEQNVSGDERIHRSFYNTSWETPAIISPAATNAYTPQIAMNNNDEAIIAWQQQNGSANEQIFISTFNGSAWTLVTGLDDNISPNGTHAYSPSVAIDSSGNMIVAWNQINGSAIHRILKSERRGGTWYPPLNVDDYAISPTGQNAYKTDVAMDNSGNAIIVWTQSDGSYQQTYKSEFRSASWTNPTDLTDNISPDGTETCFCSNYPTVSLANELAALIAWPQRGGTNPSDPEQIFYSLFKRGAWDHPADLSDNISPDEYSTYSQDSAMNSNGDAIIAWRQSSGSNTQVFISMFR